MAMPAVILASSRSEGNTRAVAEWAFPSTTAVYEDLATLRIAYYAYDGRYEDDDFLALIQRLQAHHLWVLATPLYWYTMSGQAKTFFDRLSDLLTLHKDEGRRLRGKSLAVVCAGADRLLPRSFDEPFALTCGYLGMIWLGSHYTQFDGTTPAAADAPGRAADFGDRCLR
jgi:NAD(P)H-dependent FMN reductase